MLIPEESHVYQLIKEQVLTRKIVVFSGLPGVGKSLLVTQFHSIAEDLNRKLSTIQWDMARKSFESNLILETYPMADGQIHNGVKLSVGAWLIDTLESWIDTHPDDNELLLIEAPLVGHRFIELVQIQDDQALESFLSSDQFCVIVPIPSKEVRKKIELDREAQIDESAKTWIGAKPSVMHLLWKFICNISNEFGTSIDTSGQPEYDPLVYESVFNEILKHRVMIPLHIDQIFNIEITDEKELHSIICEVPSEEEAVHYFQETKSKYSNEVDLDKVVNRWYIN